MGLNLITPAPLELIFNGTNPSNTTLDAAGESVAVIGNIYFEGGRAAAKTLSTGYIYFRTGGVTWADASTNVRIGIQDVDQSTGLEDTTFDVYRDIDPSGFSVTASTLYKLQMASGTKSISYGQEIAAVFEMTARGGADSLTIGRSPTSPSLGKPYNTVDSGSGPAKTPDTPLMVAIEFDDGTRGYFIGSGVVHSGAANVNFNSGSSPNEYGMAWELPREVEVEALFVGIRNFGAGDGADIKLYLDPLNSTPNLLESVTIDPDVQSGNGTINVPLTSVRTIPANTLFAVTVLATTGTNISVPGIGFGSYPELRGHWYEGANARRVVRAGSSGAFTEGTSLVLPMGLWTLSEPASGGGGGMVPDIFSSLVIR